MESLTALSLEVWREACRHILLSESLPAIQRLLEKRLPVEKILVRRIAFNNRYVDTAAISAGKPMPQAKLDAVQTRKLERWSRKRVLYAYPNLSSADIFELLLPGQAGEGWAAAPLHSEDQFSYVILFEAGKQQAFGQEHLEILAALLEPFSVALKNHLRLTEINSLREAAEADRQHLLNKQGCKALGETIIGSNRGLKQVMERVEVVSGSDIPVLIFGETGTGKELAARSVHNRSRRHGKPFIRVNCGAIPAELIDSQLFGHEKGAFTGAVESRKGWFEQAHGGTLFLDEVGEMSLEAQVRLLRILQDGWMERVGGKMSVRVDVRVILATHRDLYSMVSRGAFREDLWYRISTFPILLPPLRERLEDLEDIARHFAKRSALKFGLFLVFPSEEDIALLKTYSWPGNIRELASVIDRAALIGNGQSLEIKKAMGWFDDFGNSKSAEPGLSLNNERPGNDFAFLNAVIRQHIKAALIKSHGKIEGHKGAAELLGINPNTLRAKMRKLDISREEYVSS